MVSNDQNHFVREAPQAPPLSAPPMVVKVEEVVEVVVVVEVVEVDEMIGVWLEILRVVVVNWRCQKVIQVLLNLENQIKNSFKETNKTGTYINIQNQTPLLSPRLSSYLTSRLH